MQRGREVAKPFAAKLIVTLKAAIRLERIYRHTNPLHSKAKQLEPKRGSIMKQATETKVCGSYPFPVGGTEQRSMAPASFGSEFADPGISSLVSTLDKLD